MESIRATLTLVFSAYLGSATSKLYSSITAINSFFFIYVLATALMIVSICFIHSLLYKQNQENVTDKIMKNAQTRSWLVILFVVLIIIQGYFVINDTSFYKDISFLYLPITVLSLGTTLAMPSQLG